MQHVPGVFDTVVARACQGDTQMSSSLDESVSQLGWMERFKQGVMDATNAAVVLPARVAGLDWGG